MVQFTLEPYLAKGITTKVIFHFPPVDMLKHLGRWTSPSRYSLIPPVSIGSNSPVHEAIVLLNNDNDLSIIGLKIQAPKLNEWRLYARRRVIYDDHNDDDDEYGYNEEIALLETYTQSVQDEVLMVNAKVDDENVEVLVFKGISSCLSYTTSPDPTRSVLPEKAVITSIDRIRGPFDPSNILYIERGLTFDGFKNSLIHNS